MSIQITGLDLAEQPILNRLDSDGIALLQNLTGWNDCVRYVKMHTQLGGEFNNKWMIRQYVGRASRNHRIEGSMQKEAHWYSPHRSAS